MGCGSSKLSDDSADFSELTDRQYIFSGVSKAVLPDMLNWGVMDIFNSNGLCLKMGFHCRLGLDPQPLSNLVVRYLAHVSGATNRAGC